MNEGGKEGAKDRRISKEGEQKRGEAGQVVCCVCGRVRHGSEALVVELVMCVRASASDCSG